MFQSVLSKDFLKNSSDLQRIACMSSSQENIEIANMLGLDKDKLKCDLKMASYVDFLHQTTQFVLSVGMPLNEAFNCVLFSKQYLQNITMLTFSEAVLKLKNDLNSYYKLNKIGIVSCKLLCRHLTFVLLNNFRLYKHVFTQEPQENIKQRTLTVESVSKPQPLKNSKTSEQHEHCCKLMSVEVNKLINNALDNAYQSEVCAQLSSLRIKTKEVLEHCKHKNKSKVCIDDALKMGTPIIENNFLLLREQLVVNLSNLKGAVEAALMTKSIKPVKDVLGPFELKEFQIDKKSSMKSVKKRRKV